MFGLCRTMMRKQINKNATFTLLSSMTSGFVKPIPNVSDYGLIGKVFAKPLQICSKFCSQRTYIKYRFGFGCLELYGGWGWGSFHATPPFLRVGGSAYYIETEHVRTRDVYLFSCFLIGSTIANQTTWYKSREREVQATKILTLAQTLVSVVIQFEPLSTNHAWNLQWIGASSRLSNGLPWNAPDHNVLQNRTSPLLVVNEYSWWS